MTSTPTRDDGAGPEGRTTVDHRGMPQGASDGDRAPYRTTSGEMVTPEQEPEADVTEHEAEDTFDRTVDEGRRRLNRSPSALVAVGLVGGIDVGLGVMALLFVEHRTGSLLLAGLAFSIGFIALTIAGSELFTEDFLVPVTTVIAREGGIGDLLRLWGVTLVANLAGGFLITYLVIAGFPDLHETAVKAGGFYVELGITWRAFALAILGGTAITLMTYMQLATDSLGVRIVPAVAIGFLLAGLQLNHAVVNSLLMFSGLHTGEATFGYADWAATAGWAALGNMVGGIGLVTLVRLLRVPHKVRDAVRNPPTPVRRAG